MASTTVDAEPSSRPPSATTATGAVRAAAAAAAVAGVAWPWALALVVARGPTAAVTALTRAWSGHRMPMVRGSPPRSHASRTAARPTTSVSAPGQQAAAMRSSSGVQVATRARAAATSVTSTARGTSGRRSLRAKRRAVAPGTEGRAAKPYTVSVGRTTGSPARRAATNRSTTAGSTTAGSTGPARVRLGTGLGDCPGHAGARATR